MLDISVKPGSTRMRDKLRRLKDQYPKDRMQIMEFDRDLPSGEAPVLMEEPTVASEPAGTQKKFQPAKLAYKDVQFGMGRRGR